MRAPIACELWQMSNHSIFHSEPCLYACSLYLTVTWSSYVWKGNNWLRLKSLPKHCYRIFKLIKTSNKKLMSLVQYCLNFMIQYRNPKYVLDMLNLAKSEYGLEVVALTTISVALCALTILYFAWKSIQYNKSSRINRFQLNLTSQFIFFSAILKG